MFDDVMIIDQFYLYLW